MVRTARLVREFCAISEVLGPQMGCFLFQLPPSYKYSPSRLKSIVKQIVASRLNESVQYAVEFRHKTWWRKSVYAAFRKAGIIFCSVSAPRLPDDLIKTTDALYVRFHGRSRWYRYDYTRDELRDWAGKIKPSGAETVFAYFNNDRECNAIRNAKALHNLLRRFRNSLSVRQRINCNV